MVVCERGGGGVQFQRFANVYFLSVAVLATFPAISPISGTTFWFPLITVLAISAVKDALEDFRRYQSDLEENGRATEVWSFEINDFERVAWSEVTVGSLVRVRAPVTADDVDLSLFIPCDLVLLATSSEDGLMFLETVPPPPD